jgi:drug/metabolite transporter (DMT)-like permease
MASENPENQTVLHINDESTKDTQKHTHNRSKNSSHVLIGLFWLFIWFFLNVVLALLNKYIFKNTHFNFPVLLSFVHMFVGAILSYLAAFLGLYKSETEKLSPQARTAIRVFVIIFCLNIAFGNISVQIVNLAASQVVRSTTPLFMIVVAYKFLNSVPSLSIVLSVLPIVFGVALTVVGDMDLDIFSLAVLFLGNLLAALKVVLANKYINQFKLHPVDLLKELSPLASLFMLGFAVVKGELRDFFIERASSGISWNTYFMVLFTAVCAFSLNWTNMMANKYTSPLTMSVTANVKQVFLVVLSIFIYNVPMNIFNTSGIIIAFLGMFYYSYVKYQETYPSKDAN